MSTNQPVVPTDLPQLAGAWVLDPAATAVTFRTKALWGMAKVVGTIQARSGSAEVAPDGSFVATLVMDAASVDTKQSTRDKHLRGDDFLTVEEHPDLVYTATGLREDAGAAVIAGTFTVRETTKPLELHGSVSREQVDGAPPALTVVATGELDRREWGVTTVKLGSGVDMALEITAVYRFSAADTTDD